MQLAELNQLSPSKRKEELRKCCGSSAWVEKLDCFFPFENKETLFEKADKVWKQLSQKDWLEAFQHHPKIGDVASLKEKFAATANWAASEQSAVQRASQPVIEELAKGNKEYEKKFGYIFIVCATGKSADEMLALLKSRLPNNSADEIRAAAAEQAKITRLRLEKLLQ